jgi:membrane protein YqaA with SNARE-associated domain
MCPACLANILLVALGAGSSGGLITYGLTKFLRQKKQRQNHRNRK